MTKNAQPAHLASRLPYESPLGELITLPRPRNILEEFSSELDFDDFSEAEI